MILGLAGYARFQRGNARNGSTALGGIITSAIAVIFSVAGGALFVAFFADLNDTPVVDSQQTLAIVASTPAQPTPDEPISTT